MKKIALSIILCGCMIVSLTSCRINENEFDIGEKSNIQIVEKGISLSVKQGTLTKVGATLVLKNDSETDIQYGNPYEIEIKKDGSWHKINVELNFTLPAYELKTKDAKEIELNWGPGYGELMTGEYRIIKSIDIEKEDGTFDSFYVSAEFEIR